MASPDARGRKLSATPRPDGFTHVELDNGPTAIMNVLVPSESYPLFDIVGAQAVWEKLHSVPPGGYRRKNRK